MVKGIGVDLLELDRIELNDHFIKRILTEKELELFNAIKHPTRKREFLGGRFAAKEAVSKAFGTGIGILGFQDIEILNDRIGKPLCLVHDELIHVSISHSKTSVVAFAVRDSHDL